MRSAQVARWMLAPAGAALLVAACRQTLGIDQYFYAPADASAGPCAVPYDTGSCASCAATNCCNESTACASSPPCNGYETCLVACQGDPACRARCGIDHAPGTTREVSALSACLVTHCENECNLPCGAIAGWAVEPDAAAGFQTCMANHCGAVRACASSAACDAVTRCFVACSTQDCVDTCMASNGVDPAFWFPDAGVSDGGRSDATAAFVAFDQARGACASAAGA